MEILASIQNLKVQYGDFIAVDDVSFDIKAGEVVAIIGPNGSGKTSVVECLEGLRQPKEGSVEVLGKHPKNHRKEVYRKLGVQLQDVNYPNMIQVGELCALFSSFYENPTSWLMLLQRLGLSAKKKKLVSTLSGGEKQRLSILLALLPNPKLMLLDELTTGLDPEARRSICEILKSIRNDGTGILLVSHDMGEVSALANRIVFMRNGKSIYIGTPENMKKKLATACDSNISLEELYFLILSEHDLQNKEVMQ